MMPGTRPVSRVHIVDSVRPNARATPAQATPDCGTPAASTAVPRPPITSQNVP